MHRITPRPDHVKPARREIPRGVQDFVLARLVLVVPAGLAAGACASPIGDVVVPRASSPLGNGLRLQDVTNPNYLGRPAPGSTVACTGLSVVTVDTFDETQDGKSVGTMYLQDTGSHAPYSGIGTYAATFIPPDLRVSPGDVLDATGQYQENANIGSHIFPSGQVFPQLFRPTCLFRFEAPPVETTVIDPADLSTYETGRKWLGMLVTVNQIILQSLSEEGGRVSASILPGNTSNIPTMTNELFDLKVDAYPDQTAFASITGIVTYFDSFHLAPRSAADLVQ